MKLSRKQFLQAAAATGVAIPLSGCEHITSEITNRLGGGVPQKLDTTNSANIDPIFHLLSRAGFGPAPGDVTRAKTMGAKAWLDEQLHPERIDDRLCEYRTRRFETLHLDPGTCYEFKKPVLRDEMVRHAVLKATYSKRQLFETMVEFWTDHLNIYIEKGDCMYLKPADDRLVVRAHALGKFKDLIRASATSPAMLVYLDGNENRKDGPKGIPNENYARELLELHTLGVHGGYTQQDVFETGRCVTGWHLHTPWQRGIVYFDREHHDDGEKHVLGQVIPAGGGEKDLERVINIACEHPATAQHIATKLATRFVSDDPSPSLVRHLAETFKSSGGDIRKVMQSVFTSSEFAESKGTKLKRPFRYVVSCLRSLDADTFGHASVLEYLSRMGHAPFQYPTPDGYSDHPEHWANALLWRWNFALALASNKLSGVKAPIDDLSRALVAGDLAQSEHQTHNVRPRTQSNVRQSLAQNVAHEDAHDSLARNDTHAEIHESPSGNNAHGNVRASINRDHAQCDVQTFFAYLVGRRAHEQELLAFEQFSKDCMSKSSDKQAELIGLIMASPAFQRF